MSTSLLIIPNTKWDNKGVPNDIPTNITPRMGGVAIHYVGGAGKLIADHKKCLNIVRAIRTQHVRDNGWIYIAYTGLVCAHGYFYEGRGIHHRTAANGTTSGNQNYYAVCGLLNMADVPTPEMLQTIKLAVAYLRQKGGAGKKIVGHKDLYNTDCPGPLTKYVRAGTFGGSPPVANKYPGYLIKRGMTGSVVKKCQKELIKEGFPVGPYKDDGIFGVRTEAAVRNYQVHKKLSVDGVIGPKTWGALFKE